MTRTGLTLDLEAVQRPQDPYARWRLHGIRRRGAVVVLTGTELAELLQLLALWEERRGIPDSATGCQPDPFDGRFTAL